jgi:hypothetical protein
MRVRLGPVSRRRRTDLFVEKAMFRSSRSLATAQEIRFNIYGSESNTFWTIVSWGKVKHRCRAVREHSKSAILMDNNAGTRSSSAFGAEQHLCKRPSALAVLPKRQTGENTRDPKYLGRVSSLTKSHLATPSNRIQPDHFPKCPTLYVF